MSNQFSAQGQAYGRQLGIQATGTKLPKPKPMKTALEKIARLYDLIAEMRTIIAELKEVSVIVRIGRSQSYTDPLGTQADIQVIMRPGCDLIEGAHE